jgi:hypothetical protein
VAGRRCVWRGGGAVRWRCDAVALRCGGAAVRWRCGTVRCGAVRCGAVRCGAVRCGAVRCGVVRAIEVWRARATLLVINSTVATPPIQRGRMAQRMLPPQVLRCERGMLWHLAKCARSQEEERPLLLHTPFTHLLEFRPACAAKPTRQLTLVRNLSAASMRMVEQRTQ